MLAFKPIFVVVEENTDTFTAPIWIPDDDATFCTICSTEFRLLTRKHHCRMWLVFYLFIYLFLKE